MVYFKLLLNDKRPKSDNIYPIVVRVTYDRNNTTFTTGIRVNGDLWDTNSYKVKHNHPNAQALNKSIADFYSKVQGIALKLIDEQNFSFDELKDRLSENYQAPNNIGKQDFNQYASQLIAEMFSINKAGNAIIYQTATNRVMSYSGKQILKFKEINYSFLDGFRQQLIKDGVKQNTISNYFRTLRAIYNKAIKAKVIDRAQYPFLDIPIKTERTAKRALRLEDLVKLYGMIYKPNTPKWHARNYFLLSFCLRGASFTDLAYLTGKNINKGRLVYKRRKTGSELNIKILQLLESILEFYYGCNEKYLIPVLPKGIIENSLDAKKLIFQWIKTTNKWLNRIAADCEIDAEITTYVTRHSWATTAKRLGYSNELIAEAMGHEYGNKITNIYLDNFDQSLIDEMNDKVIESISK